MFLPLSSMKQRLFAAIAGIVLAVVFVGFTDADAIHTFPDSLSKDSIIITGTETTQPIFSGDEKTKVDSLAAVADVLRDTTLKHLIENTIDEIKDRPAADSSWISYISYAFGILVAIYLLVDYIRKRLRAKR